MDEPAQTTSQAVFAVARLLTVAIDERSDAAVHEAVVEETRRFFGIEVVALLRVDAGGRRLALVAGGRPAGDEAGIANVGLADVPVLAALLDRRERFAALGSGTDLTALEAMLGGPQASALALPMRSGGSAHHVLLLAGDDPASVDKVEVDVAVAFTSAAGAALVQLALAQAHARRAEQQAALTRAATALNEDLDVETIANRVAEEAALLTGADVAAVYMGSGADGLVLSGGFNMPPEAVGAPHQAAPTLAGKAVTRGRALMTNDYARVTQQPPDGPFRRARAAIAVPLRWDGALRGAVSVGFYEQRVTDEDLHLLEGYTEMAALVCRNASTHAGLQRAARTDALTGCLNHAALHEGLRREVDRARRSDTPLSLVLIDLDDFKQVNDRLGHLVGDEVLRRAGFALRQATRPYDLAARYGGDEFAIVAPDADEVAACDIAMRAIEQITEAIDDLGEDGIGRATAGVAEWTPGISATEVIARADRALLHGKGHGQRGVPVAFSSVPDTFRPGRFRRAQVDRSLPTAPPMPASPWPDRDREQTERLRKRTRQLALANDLGARLGGLLDAQAICEAAVEELHRAFGYFFVATVRLREDGMVHAAAGSGAAYGRVEVRKWEQPSDVGLIGRCITTRRPVLVGDVLAEADYSHTAETADVRSEVIVPLWVGEELWGVIDVEDVKPHAFDEDDVRILETVASQVGAALRSAGLYDRLERAYLGTAQALAAALEAKDAYTADHARSIVAQADQVGRLLGMTEHQLRDLRFGAAFHDIGKIAVAESILNKQGPLTPEERVEMEQHTLIGEQILEPVEFLSGVRPLVRHEHERWDGHGYPDRLVGEKIPLGARVIFVCDAYHAMTSDRPYRAAMSEAEARAELNRHAGTQFDARVVGALLRVLDGRAGEPPSAPAAT